MECLEKRGKVSHCLSAQRNCLPGGEFYGYWPRNKARRGCEDAKGRNIKHLEINEYDPTIFFAIQLGDLLTV